MQIQSRHGNNATGDGGDIVISLTRAESAALGAESGALTDWYISALRALVALRTGHVGGDRTQGAPDVDGTWHWVINDLDRRLLPRLEGIRDAAIRAHAGAGGTYAQLATAMDAPRSTAQSRRDAIVNKDPSFWETWAREGGPQKTQ